METEQIIYWLRDKAERAADLSWTRVMHIAADRLLVLEDRLEQSNAERDAVTKRMIELEILLAERNKDSVEVNHA